MRKRMVSLAVLASVLGLVVLSLAIGLRPWCGAPLSASAQEQKKAAPDALAKLPQSLEEMLEVALRSNPDVLVAEAKVRSAEAELNQARLKVTQEVVSLYNMRAAQEHTIKASMEELRSIKTKVDSGVAPASELSKALLARMDAETALAQADARLRYTLGIGGSWKLEARAPERPQEPEPPQPRREPRPEIPAEYQELLTKTKFTCQFDNTPLRDVLGQLRDMIGQKLILVLDRDVDWDETKVSLQAGEVTLKNSLLMLNDAVPGGLYCIFRDYGGVFVTLQPERARTMAGAALPPDLPYEVPER